jgi:hypothetical protein
VHGLDVVLAQCVLFRLQPCAVRFLHLLEVFVIPPPPLLDPLRRRRPGSLQRPPQLVVHPFQRGQAFLKTRAHLRDLHLLRVHFDLKFQVQPTLLGGHAALEVGEQAVGVLPLGVVLPTHLVHLPLHLPRRLARLHQRLEPRDFRRGVPCHLLQLQLVLVLQQLHRAFVVLVPRVELKNEPRQRGDFLAHLQVHVRRRRRRRRRRLQRRRRRCACPSLHCYCCKRL